MNDFEHLFFQVPRGMMSRIRLSLYRLFGMRMGSRNRMEGGGRVRSCHQIEIGSFNAFTQGCWLWPGPEVVPTKTTRIRIGNRNFFNRDLMIDACGLVTIGDDNMFGPNVYIADSNHSVVAGRAIRELPMQVGSVRIGNHCWIGANAVILKDVVLGDGCVVGAGAVVTRSVASGTIVAGVPARPVSHADAAKATRC